MSSTGTCLPVTFPSFLVSFILPLLSTLLTQCLHSVGSSSSPLPQSSSPPSVIAAAVVESTSVSSLPSLCTVDRGRQVLHHHHHQHYLYTTQSGILYPFLRGCTLSFSLFLCPVLCLTAALYGADNNKLSTAVQSTVQQSPLSDIAVCVPAGISKLFSAVARRQASFIWQIVRKK